MSLRKFIIALWLVLMFCGSAASASEPLVISGTLNYREESVKEQRMYDSSTWYSCFLCGEALYTVRISNSQYKYLRVIADSKGNQLASNNVVSVVSGTTPNGNSVTVDRVQYESRTCRGCGRRYQHPLYEKEVVVSIPSYTLRTTPIEFRNAQTNGFTIYSQGTNEVVIDGGTYSGAPAT